MTHNVIEVRNLGKSYGKETAIQDVSLEVKSGELFGLIGPDGAGKTTIIRILTTLLLADKGTATVLGLEVVKNYKKLRKLFGYMPGRFSLYQDLTVEENLEFFARVFDTTIEKNYHLVKPIYSHIEPYKDRRAGKLSGGMKQKLALSCALIHAPEVLFLDEPTTGVDPVSRKEFWDMLKSLKEAGITIFVSTPYMDEAKRCDTVALIQNGHILSVESPSAIEASFPFPLYSIRTNNMYYLLKHLREYVSCRTAFAFGEYVHYTDTDREVNREKLINYLTERNHLSIELQTINATIEDCFMELMREKS